MLDTIPPPPSGDEEGEGWRRFQPFWGEVLLGSFGFAGIFGLIAYFQSGHVEVLGAAGIGAVALVVILRWIYPRYRHLWWGDE